jgi:galactokinase
VPAPDRQEELHERAWRALADLASPARQDVCAFHVPGRVEFLGKHTDYAGGRSLLCTIERGIVVVASARRDRVVRIIDAISGEVAEGELEPSLPMEVGRWSSYPFTVARRLARNFPARLRGADLAIASDLPPAAGMSSSSALVVATFFALAEINSLAERAEYRDQIGSPEALAGYLGAVENGPSFGSLAGDVGVGTFGGSEDHTAMLCGRPGMLVRYAFCPVRFEGAVPLPPDHVLVIASSGVAAAKAGGAREQYNRASLATAQIARLWRDATGRDDATLASAVRSSPSAVAEIRELLSRSSTEEKSFLLDRFDQFVLESEEIIPGAYDALAAGDLSRLGNLVDRSQRAAEQLLGNQIVSAI